MDKAILKKVGWVIVIIATIINIIYHIIKQCWGYLAETLIEILVLIVVGYILFYMMPRERAVKITQYVGFGCFFIWFLLVKYLPSFLSKYILLFGIIGIIASIFLKKDMPAAKVGRTLNDKIKNQLKINSKSMKMNLPEKIGGFVMPAFPFFDVVSNKWKGNLKKEAVIHENVHLYYLQNGWLITVIFGVLVVSMLIKKIIPESVDINIVILPLVILSSVLFEYVTFNKTHKIGKAMGIITRQWSNKIALKYLWVYTLQFILVFFVYEGVKFIFIIVKGVL